MTDRFTETYNKTIARLRNEKAEEVHLTGKSLSDLSLQEVKIIFLDWFSDTLQYPSKIQKENYNDTYISRKWVLTVEHLERREIEPDTDLEAIRSHTLELILKKDSSFTFEKLLNIAIEELCYRYELSGKTVFNNNGMQEITVIDWILHFDEFEEVFNNNVATISRSLKATATKKSQLTQEEIEDLKIEPNMEMLINYMIGKNPMTKEELEKNTGITTSSISTYFTKINSYNNFRFKVENLSKKGVAGTYLLTLK